MVDVVASVAMAKEAVETEAADEVALAAVVVASGEDNHGDDDGRKVLHAAVTEGMFAVCRTHGEFGANDGNDAREGITQVVHGIEHDSHRVGKQPYKCLKTSEKNVCYYSTCAGSDNLLCTIHKLFFNS